MVEPLNPLPGPDGLDAWLAHVGEDYIRWVVDSTWHGVVDGTIPAFTDKEAFRQYLGQRAAAKHQ